MSIPPAIEIRDAGKSYRSYPSAWWRAAGWITGRPSHFTDHWVLRHVSLTGAPGQAIGIVGRNGAGKSTLLKLVAGTLIPTEGTVRVNGRVSAILELGMGFNLDFTGRENARRACSLQGLALAEVDALLPWIEEFSDVGTYFDQAMRIYSSGMAMRVAFAVATVRRPEVLIVDEALSVGDAAFQRKSFRRIEEFLTHGTTLLLVSHATESVKRICERALWIEQGQVVMDGTSKEVVEDYERQILGGVPGISKHVEDARAFVDRALTSNIEVQYGSGKAEIRDVALVSGTGERFNSLPENVDFSVRFNVRFSIECRDVHFGMMIKTLDGICVYSTNTELTHPRNRFAPGDTVAVCFELKNNLIPGMYYLNCGVNHMTDSGRLLLHRRVDVAAFRIREAAVTSATGIASLRGRPTVGMAEEPVAT